MTNNKITLAFLKTLSSPVILLEGKRNVLHKDRRLLIELGKLLAGELPNARFRSGNATGSDELFSKGVAAVDSDRLEIVTPYAGHRKKHQITEYVTDIDSIRAVEDEEVMYRTKSETKNPKLIDNFKKMGSNRVTVKAAYLIRDTVKVMGAKNHLPSVDAALFYDDLKNPESGGTGHTMRVCRAMNVSFCDQSVWIEWLNNHIKIAE
jgi:hypothetical protein